MSKLSLEDCNFFPTQTNAGLGHVEALHGTISIHETPIIIPSKVKSWPILTGGLPGTPGLAGCEGDVDGSASSSRVAVGRPYPPGNGYISHQTGSLENHRLKMPFFGGYVSSLEGNIH